MDIKELKNLCLNLRRTSKRESESVIREIKEYFRYLPELKEFTVFTNPDKISKETLYNYSIALLSKVKSSNEILEDIKSNHDKDSINCILADEILNNAPDWSGDEFEKDEEGNPTDEAYQELDKHHYVNDILTDVITESAEIDFNILPNGDYILKELIAFYEFESEFNFAESPFDKLKVEKDRIKKSFSNFNFDDEWE